MRGLALPIVVALLELTNLIAVPVAIGNRWPAEFGAKSDPNRMAADWAGTLLSGTAISAPLAPLIVLAVAAVLALLPWRWPALIGGVACCLLGVLFTIGILGEPGTLHPRSPLEALFHVVGLVLVLALILAAAREFIRRVRES